MKVYHSHSKKKPKSNKITKWIIAICIFLAVGMVTVGTHWLIFESPAFKVGKINIAGLSSMNQEEFVNAYTGYVNESSWIAGILSSKNILAWDSDSGPFVAKYPFFESIKIEKNTRKKEINLAVQERVRYGLWCMCKEQEKHADVFLVNNASDTPEIIQPDAGKNEERNCFWFDEKGIAFMSAPFIEGELFHRINDYSDREIILGAPVAPKHALENMKQIFAILDKSDTRKNTATIKDINLEEAVIEPYAAPRMLFNLRLNPAFTYGAIEDLKNKGIWEKIEYVDFRVENRATYK